jgi:hypothetical protein
MDPNAQLIIEELVMLVHEELQMFRAEMKQCFAATTSSLTCSEHVSGFMQDTTTMAWSLVLRIDDLTTTYSTTVVGNGQHGATLF